MKIGIISQCMVKPRQLNDQYLGNLALKINLKVRAVIFCSIVFSILDSDLLFASTQSM
jgi:hypothetical protein